MNCTGERGSFPRTSALPGTFDIEAGVSGKRGDKWACRDSNRSGILIPSHWM
jgi:hypothetical protein